MTAFSAVWFFSASPLEPTDLPSGPTAVKSSHVTSRKQQKEGRRVDIHLKPQALHTHSAGERPHSLADLKMYKDTKILVAKFLEHSSCSLPPDVQQVVNNIKCVIKLDEKHMEEAIFSANVIDQVSRAQGNARGGRATPRDGVRFCRADDEPAYDRKSQEARPGGPPPSELRRFEFLPVRAPPKKPPADHQRLGSPPRLPRTEPRVQGDHPLTALTRRTLPAPQAADVRRVPKAPAAEARGGGDLERSAFARREPGPEQKR